MAAMSNTAQSLRQRRVLAGLTQRDLARLSGVSLRTIARIEKGAKANGSTLRLLAHALGVESLEANGEAA